MKHTLRKARYDGFTLIELLIVILIIGVLAGIVVKSIVPVRQKAAEAVARSMIDTLNNGLEQYNSEYGYLPGRNAPSDPYDEESNVIVDVLDELLRCRLVKINEKDMGVWDEGVERYRSATKEEIDDDDIDKVLIDPWAFAYVARENDSKEKKQPWMHNKDFIDIYSCGINNEDDTIEMKSKDEGNDDIGNW